MKKVIRSLLLAGLIIPSAAYAQQDSGEIGYHQGALGYDALVSGDYKKAEAQIEKSVENHGNDPAKMINLGIIYMNTGRTAEGESLLNAAANSRDHFPLILADGREMDSRQVARLALAQTRNEIASR